MEYHLSKFLKNLDQYYAYRSSDIAQFIRTSKKVIIKLPIRCLRWALCAVVFLGKKLNSNRISRDAAEWIKEQVNNNRLSTLSSVPERHNVLYRQFTCPKTAILFCNAFQVVLFFFFLLTYAEIKAFNWLKTFFYA